MSRKVELSGKPFIDQLTEREKILAAAILAGCEDTPALARRWSVSGARIGQILAHICQTCWLPLPRQGAGPKRWSLLRRSFRTIGITDDLISQERSWLAGLHPPAHRSPEPTPSFKQQRLQEPCDARR